MADFSCVNADVALALRELTREFDVSVVRSPSEMIVKGTSGDYAYLEISGFNSDRKVFLFDTSRIWAGKDVAVAGERWHEFLFAALGKLSGGTVGGISQENAKVKTEGLTFRGGFFS